MKNTDVNKLVNDYKSTKDNEEKQVILSKIIDAFEGYIVKYVSFLNEGVIKNTDHDLKHFVKILSVNNEPSKVFSIIKQVLQHYTYEDIYNQLQMIFIQCLNRYEAWDDGPGFSGYIYGYYKFRVLQWYCKLSEDALNNVNIIPIENTNIKEQEEPKVIYNHICFIDTDIINNLEKYVTFLSYEMEFTDKEISKIIQLSRPQVTDLRNSAKKKILQSKHVIEDLLEY